MYAYIHAYIYAHIHMHICAYTYLHIHGYLLYACVRAYTYACVQLHRDDVCRQIHQCVRSLQVVIGSCASYANYVLQVFCQIWFVCF